MKLVIEIEGKPEEIAEKLAAIAEILDGKTKFPDLTMRDEKPAAA